MVRHHSADWSRLNVRREGSAPSPLIKGLAFVVAAYTLNKTLNRLRTMPDEVVRCRKSRLLRAVFSLAPSGDDEELMRWLRRRYLFVVFGSGAMLATMCWEIVAAVLR